jgi:ubiquitin-conjugating enzyme E2 S
VPNPESALNEEAGKLLLEQYDEYAKRAKIYASVHAKAGKSEFLALSKERSNNQENQNDDETVENQNDNAEKHLTETTGNNHVLKPLSDNPSVKKRPHEEEDDSKRKVKKVDKKKNLRRL